MRAICLQDKGAIEAFLRRNPFLHLYAIGDLDDFFWPYTTWYACTAGGEIEQLVLVYSGMDLPVLLAHAAEPATSMAGLLRALFPLLPGRLYAHVDPSSLPVLAERYRAEPHGAHYKMGLTDPGRLERFDPTAALRLTPADRQELEALYAASYPGHWFDPRMLETGQYYGVRRQGRLVSVAGVHVYSPRYRVAALGNITTHPQFRGRGLGTMVCARLCQALLETVDHIGLNVHVDNAAAIACYKKLGFTIVADYQEVMLTMEGGLISQ